MDDNGKGGPTNIDPVSDELYLEPLVPSKQTVVGLEITRLPPSQQNNLPLPSPDDSLPLNMNIDEEDVVGNVHVLPNNPRPPRQRLYHDGSNGPWVVYFRPKPNGKRLNLISIAFYKPAAIPFSSSGEGWKCVSTVPRVPII